MAMPAHTQSAFAVPDSYWATCCGKEAVLSPRSSAFSTQDFAHCFEADRESSLECMQDIAHPIHLHGKNDQDCDATCTSRSTDLPDKPCSRQKTCDVPAICEQQQQCFSDAAALPDNNRSSLQPRFSRVEQQRLRAERQLEELLSMVRNEQALEQEVCPRGCFLEQQDATHEQPITPQMRMIVSSWLSEVAYEFSMQQETLFLAVGLLDRFLDASTGVPRGVLQLVAVACIMLAAKQDEVVHPTVQELTDIAANCFTTQDLLRMERILLDSLNWRVKTPTAYTFLHLFTQSTAAMRAAGGAGPHAATVSRSSSNAPRPIAEPLSGMVVAKAAYLTELALLDYSMLDFRPSQIAAAALLLAESWSAQGAAVAEMQAISGYTHGELQACMSRLLHLHQCAEAADTCDSLAPFVFVKDKYAQECWLKASLQTVPAARPQQPVPHPVVGCGSDKFGSASTLQAQHLPQPMETGA